jgi:hypothetical protein
MITRGFRHAVTTAGMESLDHIDYADSYEIALPEPMDAPSFCALILQSAPRWLDFTLAARDVVAGRLGFNTQQRNYGAPVELAPGGKFGPFVVRSVSPERVVCGDSDKHLAFRAIFETDQKLLRGRFTTEVQFKDAMGRAYFTVVKPFHKRIIPVLVSGPFAGRANPRDVNDCDIRPRPGHSTCRHAAAVAGGVRHRRAVAGVRQGERRRSR